MITPRASFVLAVTSHTFGIRHSHSNIMTCFPPRASALFRPYVQLQTADPKSSKLRAINNCHTQLCLASLSLITFCPGTQWREMLPFISADHTVCESQLFVLQLKNGGEIKRITYNMQLKMMSIHIHSYDSAYHLGEKKSCTRQLFCIITALIMA